MPPIANACVEGVALVLGAAVFVHAVRQGWGSSARFVAALVLGVMAEWIFLGFYDGYSYGPFFIVLGPGLPLWIAVGWATIIHTAMQATDRMGLPWMTRPAAEALIALTIDLSLDPAAVALGWWTWARDGVFGVPLDNFEGWLWIVASFGLAARVAQRLRPDDGGARDVLGPMLAVVGAVLLVAVGQVLWDTVLRDVLGDPVVLVGMLLVFGTIALVGASRARCEAKRTWPLTVVPVVMHTAVLASLLLGGGGWRQLALVAIALPVSVVAFRYSPPRGS
jgi:uncharacterized membrane protein